MIEVFGNRMEITNPGKPLIDVFRFIDHTPISRNEKLASLMRRMTIWRNEVADSHASAMRPKPWKVIRTN